jgi:hypothetical protein
MFYVIVYAVVVQGITQVMIEPVASLEQCRAVAAVMVKHSNETFPDARCAALFFDKRAGDYE